MNPTHDTAPTQQPQDVSMMAGEPAVGYARQAVSSSGLSKKASERVSPSKDEWFDVPENYQLAMKAKMSMGQRGKSYSHEDLKQRLGL